MSLTNNVLAHAARNMKTVVSTHFAPDAKSPAAKSGPHSGSPTQLEAPTKPVAAWMQNAMQATLETAFESFGFFVQLRIYGMEKHFNEAIGGLNDRITEMDMP